MSDTDGNEPTSTEVQEAKAKYVGFVFDTATFKVSEAKMLAWAESCGETDPRFTDPSHPDFQAHPTFTAHFVSRRTLPEDFPKIGGPRGIDGGKAVDVLQPIRPGDELKASATIADIYQKTGRSGTMTFIVQRMSFTNQRDEPVSTVDWKMIRNP
jgi:acyl dehydratase